MANVTLAIDDELLRAARVKAVQQGTSVNEICRQAIADFAASGHDTADFMARLRAVAARMPASGSSGTSASAWPGREALYEEALVERLPLLSAGPGPDPL